MAEEMGRRHADGTFTSDINKILDDMAAKEFLKWLINTKVTQRCLNFYHIFLNILVFFLNAFVTHRENTAHFSLKYRNMCNSVTNFMLQTVLKKAMTL